jgi:glycosyltransferase involved in cell wall biosynthesis
MNNGLSPSISVITVVRNGASVIADCIDSVLAQQIDGLEYIVIDGASTDGTLEIIRRYGDAISVCISEPDRGLYDAMNKGLRLARGRYIHFLNADDRLRSARARFAYLKEGRSPLDHNLELTVETLDHLALNSDLTVWGDWAAGADIDFIQPDGSIQMK